MRPDAHDSLCIRSRVLLSVADATISLMTDKRMTSLCVSNESTVALEDLQFTAGEGPTIEAFDSGRPVLENQWKRVLPERWPLLAGMSVDLNVEGVFAFPLHVGAARLGALTLYQATTAPLTPGQHADAIITADVLSHVILSVQANAPSDTLAVALESAGSFRVETHQASGMLAEQLHIDVAAALVLLRGHAYATDTPLAALAALVTTRRLRVGRTHDQQIEWTTEG